MNLTFFLLKTIYYLDLLNNGCMHWLFNKNLKIKLFSMKKESIFLNFTRVSVSLTQLVRTIYNICKVRVQTSVTMKKTKIHTSLIHFIWDPLFKSV